MAVKVRKKSTPDVSAEEVLTEKEIQSVVSTPKGTLEQEHDTTLFMGDPISPHVVVRRDALESLLTELYTRRGHEQEKASAVAVVAAENMSVDGDPVGPGTMKLKEVVKMVETGVVKDYAIAAIQKDGNYAWIIHVEPKSSTNPLMGSMSLLLHNMNNNALAMMMGGQ